MTRYSCSANENKTQEKASYVLLVRNSELRIVNFNSGQSKIEKLLDNTGANLLSGYRSIMHTAKFPLYPCLEKGEEHEMLLTVHTDSVPNEGATSVQIGGNIALEIGGKLKSVRVSDLKLKKGAKIKLGEFEFDVTDSGAAEEEIFPGGLSPSKSREQSGKLALSIARDSTRIHSLRAYNPAGKEVKLSTSVNTVTSANKKTTTKTLYTFQGSVEKVSLALEYWSEVKTVQVPFDLTASLSLS